MSTKTTYICDYCTDEFKVERHGGYRPDFEPAIYMVPATHYRLTDTRKDTYDFCSKACNIMFLNGEK